MSKSQEEVERAMAALKEAGFSNNAVHELLTKRMDLRDRFAMAALTGLLAAYANDKCANTTAKMAFIHAEAMMAARMEAARKANA